MGTSLLKVLVEVVVLLLVLFGFIAFEFTDQVPNCLELVFVLLLKLRDVLENNQTLIDQLTDDIVLYKTRRETAHDEHSRAFWEREIAGRKAQARNALKTLSAEMRAHADIAAKLDLITSVQGIAEKTAIAILIRMPEIGTLSREQVAALAGLAPYDDDSGRRVGSRHIQGGRTRLRTSLYAAALPAAFFWNPQLVTFYKRLRASGKTHKMALVACARKLLIFINTVVTRATPWQPKAASG